MNGEPEENVMQCVLCRLGDTHPGETTIALERGETTVIVKGVPAAICENCGEYYLSVEVTGSVLGSAERVVSNGGEVEILRYGAG